MFFLSFNCVSLEHLNKSKLKLKVPLELHKRAGTASVGFDFFAPLPYHDDCDDSAFCFQVVVIEEADLSILGILNDAVLAAEQNFANDMITVNVATVTVNRESVDASFEKGTLTCEKNRTYFTFRAPRTGLAIHSRSRKCELLSFVHAEHFCRE